MPKQRNIVMIHCPDCQYDGGTVPHVAGNGFLEVFLWLIFFPAGIFYSLYRHNNKDQLDCPRCGSKNAYQNNPQRK